MATMIDDSKIKEEKEKHDEVVRQLQEKISELEKEVKVQSSQITDQ